jgi:hypothetical protein
MRIKEWQYDEGSATSDAPRRAAQRQAGELRASQARQ